MAVGEPLPIKVVREMLSSSVVRVCLLAAVGAILLAACGTQSSRHHGARLSIRQRVEAAHLADDFIAFEFPRNASDWNSGNKFIRFADGVIYRRLDACMEATRLRPPQALPDTGPDNTQFPDLSRIKKSGSFGATT